MDNISLSDQDVAERARAADDSRSPVRRRRPWRALAVLGVVAVIAAVGGEQVWRAGQQPAAPPPPPPQVTVSRPLQQTVQTTAASSASSRPWTAWSCGPRSAAP